MSNVTKIKLALAATGLLVWIMGTAYAHRTVQYAGIVILAAAVFMRFFVRGNGGSRTDTNDSR